MERVRGRKLSLDLALLAAAIGAAVEEASADAAKDAGPMLVVMDLAEPARYRVIRAAEATALVAELERRRAPERPDIGDILDHLVALPHVPRDLLPKRVPKHARRRNVRSIKPAKEAPRKAPSRKPPTRRKRRP